MALIIIDEAVVKRSFWNGKGLEVAEQFDRNDGTKGERKYSAFFDNPHGLNENQKVKISGLLGWKSRIWDNEGESIPVTDITINSPRVEVLGGGEAATEEGLPW